MDVLTGSLVGMIFATLTFYICSFNSKEYVFYEPLVENLVEELTPSNFVQEKGPVVPPTTCPLVTIDLSASEADADIYLPENKSQAR